MEEKKKRILVILGPFCYIVVGLLMPFHLYAQDEEYEQAVRYEQGNGVTQDLVDAAEWYLKAQEKSHPKAAAALEKMYFTALKEKNVSKFKSTKDFQSNNEWVEKCREERFVDIGLGLKKEIDILWEKKGSVFQSKMFRQKTRFHADFGEEDYSEPFEGMLNGPRGEFSLSVSPNSIIIRNLDQIQLKCYGSRSTDYAAKRLGCKTGSRKGSTRIKLLGGEITVPYTISCTHSIYQTSRYVVQVNGMTTNRRTNATKTVILPSGRKTKVGLDDPYAPWRQAHDQTTTFNLDEIARLNKISKKELVARLLLSEKYELPIMVPNEANKEIRSGLYGNCSTYEWTGEVNVRKGEAVDEAVLTYFLSKQFGITEEYLREQLKIISKESRELTSIYKQSVRLEKERLEKAVETERQRCIDTFIANLSAEKRASIENAKQQGIEFVDLGLSTLWAKSSLGANSTKEYSAEERRGLQPIEKGLHYAWGDPNGFEYDYVEWPYDKKKNYKPLIKAKKGTELNESSDPATIILGKACCTPSIEQWEELIDKCHFTVLPDNRTLKATGPNGNSVTFNGHFWTRNADPKMNDWAVYYTFYNYKREINTKQFQGPAKNTGLIRPVVCGDVPIDRTEWKRAVNALEKYEQVHNKYLQ